MSKTPEKIGDGTPEWKGDATPDWNGDGTPELGQNGTPLQIGAFALIKDRKVVVVMFEAVFLLKQIVRKFWTAITILGPNPLTTARTPFRSFGKKYFVKNKNCFFWFLLVCFF